MVHSTGAQVNAAIDNQLLDLPPVQNQALLQTIQQALAPIQQALAPLQQSIYEVKVEMHNGFSRIHNANAGHPTFLLKTIKRNPPALQPDAAQPAAALALVPHNFPATYGDYSLLTHVLKRGILQFYGIQNVNVNDIDTTLRAHLGLPLPAN